MTRRSLVLFVSAAVLAALIIVVWAILRSRSMAVSTEANRSTVSSLQPIDPVTLRKNWQEGVQSALDIYDKDHDASRARALLLALAVPGDAKEMHLMLVLAFDGILNKRPGAEAELVQDRKAFSWYVP